MKKVYFINLSLVVGLVIIFNLVALIAGYTIGTGEGDFLNQHMLFIDYLRQNFQYSHDLFPQFNMNMGMGQSMVSLYYHGLYNPFIMLTCISPFDNVLVNMLIIWFIIFILNALLMTKLLQLNKIDNRINTVVTLIFCFSTSIIYHMSYHVMFVYYIPFFILSFIGLHYFVEKDIKSIYIISLALVFYTNFFFAPIVSVVQFLYYVGLLAQNNKISLKKIAIFFYPYLIAVFLGMFILIPSFLFGVSSRMSEGQVHHSYSVINNFSNLIFDITWDKYCSFFGFITIFVLVGTFLVLNKRRFYIMIIPLIAILIFNYLNLFLNVFQYVHTKIYMYMAPIIAITFAHILQEGLKNSKVLRKVVFISIVLGFISALIFFDDLWQIILIFLVAVLFILLIFLKEKLQLVVLIFLVSINFFNSSNFIKIENSNQYNQIEEKPSGFTNFREDTLSRYNQIDSITSQSPQIYTSLENGNYLKFLRDDIEVEKSGNSRKIKGDIFDNIYLKNYLAIPDKSLEKQNGIFYGVGLDSTCNITEYENMNPIKRVLAINECVFVKEEANEYKSKFNIQKIYSTNQEFNLPKSKEYKIPNDYKSGMLIITFDVDYSQIQSKKGKVKINNHANDLIYEDFYGLFNNEQVTFLLDLSEYDALEIKSDYKTKNNDSKPFSNLQIYYQTLEDFNTNKLDTYSIDNLKVDINDSYSFDINMLDEGYLCSTIPYDKGFTLLVDGNEVKVEKINGRFIGAKLPKGEHSIKLSYHIRGFNLGITLSSASFILLVFEIYKDKVRTGEKSEKN